ncbi:MAG TPA: TPM domain-containing protein [Ramlibacter sp.]|nr:TPM domain-containing protein [Ramlibacter sp.]
MKRVLALLLALFTAGSVLAQGVLPVPALSAHVIDQTGTLDAIQQKGLEDKLMAFETAKGTQIAMLMVATTQPEDIASYANRVGNAWKIGRKGVGDGVLLVVAKDDRKVRIEVAKTLEGAIPDLAARQIIENAITPNFRKGDYGQGLHAAADQLIARINGEALPAPAQPSAKSTGFGQGFDWMDTAIFLFIAVPVVGGILRGVLGRKLGSFVTGAGVGTIALLITSSIVIAGIAAFIALVFTMVSGGLGGGRRGGMGGVPWIGGGGGGGGWSGGGGGGWGGSGGGGDFGGGGASGDW